MTGAPRQGRRSAADVAVAVSSSPARWSRTPHGTGALLLQWLRFIVVGASNTILSWCVYAVLEHVGVHYLLASGLAFALGAANSYVLNRRWTFHSQGRRAPEVWRFGVVQCAGLGIDVGLLYVLTQDAGVHHLIAQALVFPVASATTFVLSRQWAFRASRA